MKRVLALLLVFVLCAAVGCANMTPTQQRALSGGAIGAAGGAAVGAIVGGSPALGAAVGGAAGAAAGRFGVISTEPFSNTHQCRAAMRPTRMTHWRCGCVPYPLNPYNQHCAHHA